jgi:hypothetical protein
MSNNYEVNENFVVFDANTAKDLADVNLTVDMVTNCTVIVFPPMFYKFLLTGC